MHCCSQTATNHWLSKEVLMHELTDLHRAACLLSSATLVAFDLCCAFDGIKRGLQRWRGRLPPIGRGRRRWGRRSGRGRRCRLVAAHCSCSAAVWVVRGCAWSGGGSRRRSGGRAPDCCLALGRARESADLHMYTGTCLTTQKKILPHRSLALIVRRAEHKGFLAF